MSIEFEHRDRVARFQKRLFAAVGFNLEREGPKAETIIVGRVTKLESKSRYGLA